MREHSQCSAQPANQRGLLMSELIGSLWQLFYNEGCKSLVRNEGQVRFLCSTSAHMWFLLLWGQSTGKVTFSKLKLIDMQYVFLLPFPPHKLYLWKDNLFAIDLPGLVIELMAFCVLTMLVPNTLYPRGNPREQC